MTNGRRDLGATLPSPSQLRRGTRWTADAKKTPSRAATCLQPLGVFVVDHAPDISTQRLHYMFPQPRAPAAMTSTVQLSEPQPDAYAKDSAIAARRAAAGRIGRTAVLCVCPRCHSVRGICYNLRSCYLVECMREKMAGIFTQPCS